ncbi:hypothetical protein F8388_005005 [Cannabis sativa]|uniref:Uncharacterized protein n=1 Tax=Cannabis sativa TaxID=3483 RepID=A0A7J6FYY8_CANSA|nr:hypothetical protein F8388_005005 [Cannabis sativa]
MRQIFHKNFWRCYLPFISLKDCIHNLRNNSFVHHKVDDANSLRNSMFHTKTIQHPSKCHQQRKKSLLNLFNKEIITKVSITYSQESINHDSKIIRILDLTLFAISINDSVVEEVFFNSRRGKHGRIDGTMVAVVVDRSMPKDGHSYKKFETSPISAAEYYWTGG